MYTKLERQQCYNTAHEGGVLFLVQLVLLNSKLSLVTSIVIFFGNG